MSWQEVDGRRYYYRHRRLAGRPQRIYVGTGPAAELAAAADAIHRLEREIQRRERQAEQARHQEVVGPFLELCDGIDTLARAAFVAAGFYRHARGEWRRRHGREEDGNGV